MMPLSVIAGQQIREDLVHHNREEQVDVQELAPASFTAGKVWRQSDLELLDELSAPVIVTWIKFPSTR